MNQSLRLIPLVIYAPGRAGGKREPGNTLGSYIVVGALNKDGEKYEIREPD
jgi:hypothetical protein